MLRAVDLDLDVVRGNTGRVWVDDEDEFADHRVRFGYPDEIAAAAMASCDRVHAAVVAGTAPYDGSAALLAGPGGCGTLGGCASTSTASPEPTLGVEWELALVDRRTRDLRNDATHLFARAKPRLADPNQLHKELLRNTVEVVTGICRTVGEAMADLRQHARGGRPGRRRRSGIDLYGGGTHPFASWTAQQLSEGHRYEELINRTQWWGRQMLIWGVHVHVGLPERRTG